MRALKSNSSFTGRFLFIAVVCAFSIAISGGMMQPVLSRQIDGQPSTPLGNRSPVDLIVSRDETWLAVANQTAGTVSIVGLSEGKVLHELAIGKRPTAIAQHPTLDRLFVTCADSGDLHILDVEDRQLKSRAVVQLGYYPHGIAITSDGTKAFIALTDADAVAVVDLVNNVELKRISVGRWPRYLALSGDESRLAVGTSGDRGISIVDIASAQSIHLDRFVGLNIGQMQLSKSRNQVYFPWMVYRRNPISERNVRIGWVLASRVGRIGFNDAAHREAISLDPPGRAVADPHGLAITTDESLMAVTSSGTGELLIFRVAGLPFEEHGSTDHIDPQLQQDTDRFYRIDLGGRPMAVRFSADGVHAFVANYLDSSVQIVDIEQREVTQRIDLGREATPSLVRKGEAIFYDAQRSLDQWYSCHSCHYEGGTNSVVMDTENDGTQFTFKTVLPLYQFDQSGPWTWHGWQKDSKQSLSHSMRTTMLGPSPSERDVEALEAYLSSLREPLNPNRNDANFNRDSVRRGEQIFHSDAGACAECHRGERFTDEKIHDLQLGDAKDAYKGFNTPSLVGVFRKVALLHDGRAATLTELLSGSHAPEKVAGRKLSEQELADLVEYLKTL